MRYILAFLLGLLLCTTVCSQKLDVNDETFEEEQAAQEQFDKFCNSYDNIMCITWRKDAHSNWTARIYRTDAPGVPVEWEEVDYPRVKLAIVAVENDFRKHLNGGFGHYRGTFDIPKEKPGYCSAPTSCAQKQSRRPLWS